MYWNEELILDSWDGWHAFRSYDVFFTLLGSFLSIVLTNFFSDSKMPKAKKKTTEEKLAQAREHKRKKYLEIKNDPEKYAIQKEKERQRYKKRKEQKKIKNVGDMKPREKRLQRKKWKENTKRHFEKKKKQRAIQQMLIDNSPPSSDREEFNYVEQDPLEGPSNRSQEASNVGCMNCSRKVKLIRKIRYIHKKKIGKLQEEIEKVTKEKNELKKMLARARRNCEKLKEEAKQPSTEQKVDSLILNIDEEKREEVKKKLLFGEVLGKNLKEGYRSLKKKEKCHFTDIILKHKENFRKYNILGKIALFTVRDKKETLGLENSDISASDIKQLVVTFFEDDSNSKISPAKKEFRIRNGVWTQKRYLTDTLLNLHKKFINVHNINIGYSTFCKHRPYWVEFPKETERDTCSCKIHVNFDLLLKSLNKNKIIKETNGTTLLESLCCNVYNEKCLNRTCEVCKRKEINYKEFNNNDKIFSVVY